MSESQRLFAVREYSTCRGGCPANEVLGFGSDDDIRYGDDVGPENIAEHEGLLTVLALYDEKASARDDLIWDEGLDQHFAPDEVAEECWREAIEYYSAPDDVDTSLAEEVYDELWGESHGETAP